MTGITFAITRYASDWLKQISYAVQPIRGSTQIWVVTSHQYEIPVCVPRTSFCGGIRQWWHCKLSAVSSGY